ncbi:MAG: elongation factor G [Chloroflexi bacterium]|nr:elongation factor G [Chloroflexota bacterium]
MQVYATDKIRNVILLSHGGAGKTSLAEALLYNTGAINRLGRVDDGTTTSDYEPEEIKRHSSIQCTLVPCEWKGVKVNVLDAPGYADFVGEVKAGIRAADAALVLIDAAAGIEVGTEMVWKYADELNLPRFLIVNKVDRENADFPRALQMAQAKWGKKCVPIQVAIGSQTDFKGVADLLDSGAEVPGVDSKQVEKLRETLVEAVAETDDALVTKYLDGQPLERQELVQGLRAGVLKGSIVPVLAAAAAQNLGVKELLDAIVAYLPAPAERPPVEATNPHSKAQQKLAADPNGPLCALVFKTTADPYVGKLSYFRVFSGTLKSDSQVWNVSKDVQERIGTLFVHRGKAQDPVPALSAGDIGAVAKLAATSTGDTLGQKDKPLLLSPIVFPEPVFSLAVHPKTKADLDKLGTALTRLLEEDPSLRMAKEQSTGETVLSGMGDVHLEMAVERMKRKSGVEVLVDVPKVPYRETVRTPAKAEYKHKKQTGGHGQYGHVFLSFDPLPRGGIEFTEKVVGGAVPKNFFPAVEKGVRDAVQEGVLAGYPMTDIRITLYDGSYHPVDSSEMSFKIAAVQCVKKGVAQANPVLLEPIMLVRVTVPDTFTGDIIGDLNSRRARVLGMIPQEGLTTIEALAPLAEMQRYAATLRSLTQGRGIYTMKFERYEEVPAHVTQGIVEQAKAAQAQKA